MTLSNVYIPTARAQPQLRQRLHRGLAVLTVAGLLLSGLLPSYTHAFGWTRLWLVLMPATAWWAVHRFKLPAPVLALAQRRRRSQGQARRRRASRALVLARAA